MTAQATKTKPVDEKPTELATLKPNFHGIGIDLKEAGRRIRRLATISPSQLPALVVAAGDRD